MAYIRWLPNGNKNDFPKIEQTLQELGIDYTYVDVFGGREYRLTKEAYEKLPTDEHGYYLPLNDSQGFSMYEK